MERLTPHIVVSDANIFIDLCDAGIIEAFFQMPWQIHTTDMVFSEVSKKTQNQELVKYRSKIVIKSYSPDELMKLWQYYTEVQQTCNLSVQDCSLLSYCLENNYSLLTGDKTLRTKATDRKISVHGVIYIFDQLVELGIISPSVAAESLRILQKTNLRLPHNEIEKRLANWDCKQE